MEEAETIVDNLQTSYESAGIWKKGKLAAIQLPRPSGSLEGFYYQKALKENISLSATDGKLLNEKAQAVWHALEKLDEQYKALEIYIRLNEYKEDKL